MPRVSMGLRELFRCFNDNRVVYKALSRQSSAHRFSALQSTPFLPLISLYLEHNARPVRRCPSLRAALRSM